MTSPRITPIDPPYEPSIAETFARIMPPGRQPLKLFRTMARNPRILQRLFAGNLLDKGAIAIRDREIMILRTCIRCGSEYEWGVHVAFFAKHTGLSSAQIASMTGNEPASGIWPAREELLIRLADELHDTASVSDALWDRLTGHFTPEQMLELIALAGYYHTIAFITNAVRIEVEDYAPRFKDMA
jgi:alkylhydroperoxidase family enzyme